MEQKSRIEASMHETESRKKRILTGDRTTGRLHLGHYVGSLQNRVRLQEEYDTFIILADIQALTTHFDQPELIRESIYETAIDNLSVGLNPEKVTLFQQSKIPAIAELTIFYSMLVTVNALRHNPTIKTEAKQYGYNELSYGFLGYPVSQTADITFCEADLVPVGEDQVPHLELSRKIARRFNDLYGAGEKLIKEPEVLLSNTPRLMGLDGNAKMGKSLGNAIYLSDTEKELQEKIRNAVTDPGRIRATDKGNPEICVINKYHEVFNTSEVGNICELCRAGNIGCVACKKKLYEKINELVTPFQEKRAYYESHRELVREILMEGSKKAERIGGETVKKLRGAMSLRIEE